MNEQQETKTFEITTSKTVMRVIERFLALLHHNSNYGHSACFGMWLDGDGSDKVSVKPRPKHAGAVDAIGGVGYDVELAGPNSYSGIFKDKKRESEWKVESRAVLLKEGEVRKVMSRE